MRCALPPGGGSKSARSLLPDRRPSHSQIFFAGAGIFGNSNAIKEIKSRVISGPGDGRGRPKSRFIFTTPRGRSDLWKVSIPDRRARDTDNFASLQKLFFHGRTFVA